MTSIRELARVIRSKNSSPFKLTLDIIFKEQDVFDEVRRRNLVTPETVARAYRIDPGAIEKVIYFEPAKAVKIGMKRLVRSGSPGDNDVYGAQQHAPLLTLEFDLFCRTGRDLPMQTALESMVEGFFSGNARR